MEMNVINSHYTEFFRSLMNTVIKLLGPLLTEGVDFVAN
jgi:hypothetical protein